MASLDIIARTSNTEFGYIPSPVAKIGPVENFEISAYDAYKLITTYPQIFMCDSASKEQVNLINFSKYFPDFNIGGGGGNYMPAISTYTKEEIDHKIEVISNTINNLDDKLNSVPSRLIPAHYERDTEYVSGKLLWIEPGNLYQVTEDYTSANESTNEESLISDVANGKLVSVAISSGSGDYDTLYTQINQLTEQINQLKDRMEFSTFDEFPETGNASTLYIDTSSGESYLWNDTTSSYQRLDMETLDDIDVIQSEIE